MVGELGLLAPENKRTQTFECIEDGELQSVTYENVRRLYFQNPKFGFHFLKLASARLFQNLERLECEVEKCRGAARHRPLEPAAPP
jgi:CRP-like cAMP-binding protein